MEDVDLAIQAKQGSIDAYETLMRRHQNVAQRAAYLVTDIATRSVHKFDSEGAHLASWTADDAEVGPFIRPWSLAIEGDTRQILVYEPIS